jgi:HD superfamily phosphodiesterase
LINFNDIKNSPAVKAYIEAADKSLLALGYTEHSYPHVLSVAENAARILFSLGYDERTVELAKIAGYLHDIGNLVNRIAHSQSGAIMAFKILTDMNMHHEEVARVVAAIGNHDEGTGVPIDELSAALILADKSDVRRTRVRNHTELSFDIHDRVNYSVEKSSLEVDREKSLAMLSLSIDIGISSIADYFEIFLDRMILCRRAAEKLALNFELYINGQKLI